MSRVLSLRVFVVGLVGFWGVDAVGSPESKLCGCPSAGVYYPPQQTECEECRRASSPPRGDRAPLKSPQEARALNGSAGLRGVGANAPFVADEERSADEKESGEKARVEDTLLTEADVGYTVPVGDNMKGLSALVAAPVYVGMGSTWVTDKSIIVRHSDQDDVYQCVVAEGLTGDLEVDCGDRKALTWCFRFMHKLLIRTMLMPAQGIFAIYTSLRDENGCLHRFQRRYNKQTTQMEPVIAVKMYIVFIMLVACLGAYLTSAYKAKIPTAAATTDSGHKPDSVGGPFGPVGVEAFEKGLSGLAFVVIGCLGLNMLLGYQICQLSNGKDPAFGYITLFVVGKGFMCVRLMFTRYFSNMVTGRADNPNQKMVNQVLLFLGSEFALILVILASARFLSWQNANFDPKTKADIGGHFWIIVVDNGAKTGLSLLLQFSVASLLSGGFGFAQWCARQGTFVVIFSAVFLHVGLDVAQLIVNWKVHASTEELYEEKMTEARANGEPLKSIGDSCWGQFFPTIGANLCLWIEDFFYSYAATPACARGFERNGPEAKALMTKLAARALKFHGMIAQHAGCCY